MFKESLSYLNTDIPKAFSLEIKEPLNYQAFYKRLESYLGEYRFQLPKYFYEYQWKKDQGLFDSDTNESMIKKAERALEKMQNLGRGERELAEFRGLDNLNKIIGASQIGDMLVWVSPPGKKEDGYGDYGFFFLGMVDGVENDSKHISMIARRVEGKDLEKYNRVLSEIIGEKTNLTQPEDFLANPFMIRDNLVDPEVIIDEVFGEIDNNAWGKFKQSMKHLKPLASEIFELFKNGSITKLKQLFNAIENLSLEFSHSNGGIPLFPVITSQMISFYSYKPPIISGSCGPSDDSKSLDIFESPNPLLKLLIFESSIEKLLKNKNENNSEEVCVTCPYCGNKEHNKKTNSGYICGNGSCSSNRKN